MGKVRTWSDGSPPKDSFLCSPRFKGSNLLSGQQKNISFWPRQSCEPLGVVRNPKEEQVWFSWKINHCSQLAPGAVNALSTPGHFPQNVQFSPMHCFEIHQNTSIAISTSCSCCMVKICVWAAPRPQVWHVFPPAKAETTCLILVSCILNTMWCHQKWPRNSWSIRLCKIQSLPSLLFWID